MNRIALIAALAAAPALAHEYAVGAITVDHPFAFATPPGAPVAGGYMTIINEGPDDVLLSAEVDDALAGMVQLHEMTNEDGVMRMSEVESGIPVPSGETVRLEQGGLHVMFMGLGGPLEEGTEFPATLTFRDAGEVEVVFQVEARGSAPAAGHGDHGSDR